VLRKLKILRHFRKRFFIQNIDFDILYRGGDGVDFLTPKELTDTEDGDGAV
jgi:hypothetical protein